MDLYSKARGFQELLALTDHTHSRSRPYIMEVSSCALY